MSDIIIFVGLQCIIILYYLIHKTNSKFADGLVGLTGKCFIYICKWLVIAIKM